MHLFTSRIRRLGPLLLVCVLLLTGLLVFGQDNTNSSDNTSASATPDAADPRFVGQVAGAEFTTGLDWFNVAQPLTLEGLQGKIVLLDFWTYGCINCLHMIPVLEQIEQKYDEEMVVIGVHSAKFDSEGASDNIRQIVQRYNLKHPVVNDAGFDIWGRYGISAWPTLVMLDPYGNIVARQSGELPFDVLDRYIGEMVAYYDGLPQTVLRREPLDITLEGASQPATLLRYPGKVLADAASDRLFISDTNHNRIVVARLSTAEVLFVAGDGQQGARDGSADEARFDQPQGMALNGATLYVTDTNNHLIRAIDLNTRAVTTIAGDGSMAVGLMPYGPIADAPTAIALRSPWDVTMAGDGNTLYIAMAGSHQIWSLDLAADRMAVTVGNGYEANLNGGLDNSELAQPSGLYRLGEQLYFADSESSTIRVADFVEQRLRIVAGTTSNSLFEFGDRDGVVGTSRLQHALGVTGNPDEAAVLYVADTYNNKIRRIDLDSEETTTLAGAGETGAYVDGLLAQARFDEPGGLSFADGVLYIADTNNHVIRLLDLAAGTVSTLQFANPDALALADVTVIGGNSETEVVELEAQSVTPGQDALLFSVVIPEGYKLNPLITSTLDVDDGVTQQTLTFGDTPALDVTVAIDDASEAIDLHLTLFYCEAEQEAYCLIEDVPMRLPLLVSQARNDGLQVEWTITPPQVDAGGF